VAFGVFSDRDARIASSPVQRISVGPKSYGVRPGVPISRGGAGRTPALVGLFRAGRLTVGISKINAMATNVLRGSGF
jgi:hypothetical protein